MMKNWTWERKLSEGPTHGEPGSKRKKKWPTTEQRRIERKKQRQARKITQQAKRKK